VRPSLSFFLSALIAHAAKRKRKWRKRPAYTAPSSLHQHRVLVKFRKHPKTAKEKKKFEAWKKGGRRREW
jgi:hypothetical protein